MPIAKKFLKSKDICKVTFQLPKGVMPEAKKVAVVGSFNHWDRNKDLMKQLKSGIFKLHMDLETGKTYEFRYLIDDQFWFTDEDADYLVPTKVSNEQNGVLDL